MKRKEVASMPDESETSSHSQSEDEGPSKKRSALHQAPPAAPDMGEEMAELEKKRLSSRLSSRRSQERKLQRIQYLYQKNDQLVEINKTLKTENSQLRDAIKKVRAVIHPLIPISSTATISSRPTTNLVADTVGSSAIPSRLADTLAYARASPMLLRTGGGANPLLAPNSSSILNALASGSQTLSGLESAETNILLSQLLQRNVVGAPPLQTDPFTARALAELKEGLLTGISGRGAGGFGGSQYGVDPSLLLPYSSTQIEQLLHSHPLASREVLAELASAASIAHPSGPDNTTPFRQAELLQRLLGTTDRINSQLYQSNAVTNGSRLISESVSDTLSAHLRQHAVSPQLYPLGASSLPAALLQRHQQRMNQGLGQQGLQERQDRARDDNTTGGGNADNMPLGRLRNVKDTGT